MRHGLGLVHTRRLRSTVIVPADAALCQLTLPLGQLTLRKMNDESTNPITLGFAPPTFQLHEMEETWPRLALPKIFPKSMSSEQSPHGH